MKVKCIVGFKRSLRGYLIDVEIDILKEVIIPFLWLIYGTEKFMEMILQINLKAPV